MLKKLSMLGLLIAGFNFDGWIFSRCLKRLKVLLPLQVYTVLQ
jgi:hypothetical protein